jgi:predicted nucleic acid-binding protein
MLVDANIVFYATGRPHPYKRPCLQILVDAARGVLQANVDVEVFQEVLHAYSLRGERKRGLSTFDDLLLTFPAPISIEREDIIGARTLLEHYTGLSARDAIHAAVVLNHGLEAIISADRAFDEITEIKRLDPLELYQ